jgi:predicted secreted protein
MTAPRVSVRANAERPVAPDSFALFAAVSAVEPEAAAARALLVARYADLEESVAELPESVEVRRGELATWPEGGRRQQRWRVRRSMTLVGHDVSLVADVAAAVARTPEVEIDGPHWNLDRDNPVYADLQADVVRLARARAERYAVALGGTLGRLIELSDPEGGSFGGLEVAMASAAGGGPDIGELDFTPEEVTVHASVNATWALVLPE